MSWIVFYLRFCRKPFGGRGHCVEKKITLFSHGFPDGWTDARWKNCPRFDFSSRTDRLPRDKSGKELRFDECPSGRAGPPCRSSLERHRYPWGPPFTRNTTIPSATKITRSSRFRMIRPGLAATTIFRRRHPPKPLAPQRRIVNFEGVPLCERSTRCHRGLPTSDTVTKVVIVWNTSAGEASSVRSIHRYKLPSILTGISHLYNCRIPFFVTSEFLLILNC